MIALILSSANATPLEITVVPEPPKTHAQRDRSPVAPKIPVGMGGVFEINGVLDEAAWAQTPVGPPLKPLRLGPAPPDIEVKVHLGDDGLLMGLVGLASDQEAFLTIDPDGAGREKWKITLSGSEATWRHCDFGGVEFPFEVYTSTRALVCETVDTGEAVQGKDGWEVLLPWASTNPSEQLGIALSVRGPRGTGGEWTAGYRLDIPRSGSAIRVSRQLYPPEWQVTLSVQKGEGQQWRWELWNRNELLKDGQVVPRDGRTQWTVPARFLGNGQVIAWGPTSNTPLPAMARARTGKFHAHFVVATPVFADQIELGWELSDPAQQVELQVTDLDEGVLARGVVDIPAGMGRLLVQADPHWPEAVRVQALPHLEPHVILREAQ